MSFQLNGTPVAIGVVNRLDSVMMILCGSPLASFTDRKPSAPAPPALLMTTIDSFINLCLTMMPWIRRAIWSAPPPVPAGITNSTGLVGSHAAWADGAINASAAAAAQDSRVSERPRVVRRWLVLALIVMSPVEWQCGSGERGV